MRILPSSHQGTVSIHASVKDATLLHKSRYHSSKSFNPRICKRCDKDSRDPKYIFESFNPRIRKRCDILSSEQQTKLKVSIHASVKDATKGLESYQYVFCVSIHASVKDATLG